MFVMPFIVNFLQLKSIGGDDKDTQYYARKFDEKAKDQRKLYNVAKILIAIFQPFASLISMVATQIVLSSKKGRQNLGELIRKYVSKKYAPLRLHKQTAEKDIKQQASYGTISEEDRTGNKLKQEQATYGTISEEDRTDNQFKQKQATYGTISEEDRTGNKLKQEQATYGTISEEDRTDNQFKQKQATYGTISEEDRTDNQFKQKQADEEILFYYLGRVFIPVATIALLLLFISDCLLFSWYKNTTKKFLYLFPIPCIAISLFGINAIITIINIRCCLKKQYNEYSKQCNRSAAKQNHFLKQLYMLVYIFLVPVSVFPYLWFHGIWIFVALIIYPGRIIIGATFILPLLLVPILLWNLCIEIYTYFKESEIKTAVFLLFYLFVSLIFWSLFIAILVIVSKLILDSNVNVPNDEDLFKSIFTFIFVNASSGIFLWLNRKLAYVVFNLTEKKLEDKSGNSV